jgi:hypothetical protein
VMFATVQITRGSSPPKILLAATPAITPTRDQ